MDVQSLGCRLSVQTDAARGVPYIVFRIHGIRRDSDDAVCVTVAEVDVEGRELAGEGFTVAAGFAAAVGTGFAVAAGRAV